jgi:O-antigen ligase
MISISVMQAAYILAVGAWLLRLHVQGHLRHIRLPLIIPVCGFALASLLATVGAIAPYKSLIELRNVLEVVIFYLTVNTVRSEAHATTLMNTLIAVGTAMALYGISQAVANGTAARVSGTTMYMTFAGQLMLISILALAQILFHGLTRHTFWLIPALLVLLAALLLTHTRNAWLGLIVAYVIMLGLRHKLLLLVLPLIATGAFLLAPPAVKNRILSMGNLQDITVQERLSMWRSGLHMVREHPLTGVGMGVMPEMSLRYREPQTPIAPQRGLSHLHNNVVQVVAERGLIGLTWWLALWGTFFYHTWHIYRRLEPSPSPAKALVVGSLAGIVGFLVAGLFEHNFGDSEVVSLVYFLMAFPFLVNHTSSPTPQVEKT